MRAIKFRFWNGFQMIKNKDISYIDFSNKFVTIKDKYHDGLKQIDFNENKRLMQYTGEKDLNEVEIYEGDIVETTRALNHIVGVVVMIKGCWYIQDEKDSYYRLIPRFGKVENKVIGNIYEK